MTAGTRTAPTSPSSSPLLTVNAGLGPRPRLLATGSPPSSWPYAVTTVTSLLSVSHELASPRNRPRRRSVRWVHSTLEPRRCRGRRQVDLAVLSVTWCNHLRRPGSDRHLRRLRQAMRRVTLTSTPTLRPAACRSGPRGDQERDAVELRWRSGRYRTRPSSLPIVTY